MSIFNSCIEKKNNTLLESVVSNCNNIESLEEGVFKYTPSMIPVCSRETKIGTKYLVEYTMLNKLAAHNDMDIMESFEAVCNENSLNESDVFVLCPDIYNSICESADAIIGSEEDSDIITYENQMEIMTGNYKALIENGVNILFEGSNAFSNIKGWWKACQLRWKSMDNAYAIAYGVSLPDSFAKFKYEFEKMIKKCSTYEDYAWVRSELKRSQKYCDDAYNVNTDKGSIKWFEEQDEFLKSKMDELRSSSYREVKGQKKVDKQRAKDEAKEAKKAAKAAKKAGAGA